MPCGGQSKPSDRRIQPEGESDFYFVEADGPEAAVPRIVELVKTRIPSLRPQSHPRYPGAVSDEPGRRRCALAQHRTASRFESGRQRKVERFGWVFAPGDKVIQIENDYEKEVYNGDIGYVVDVDPDDGEINASFGGRSVTYGFGELDTLVPAYADQPRSRCERL